MHEGGGSARWWCRCTLAVLRFSYLLPARASLRMYYLHPLVCALNARVQVSAKTRGGGTRAVEDIDEIIPTSPPSFPHRPGRARYFRASQASLWHISLASLCLFRSPSLFHPLEPGSPTARRAWRGWLEGKRICGERWGGGGWKRRDEWKPPRSTQP